MGFIMVMVIQSNSNIEELRPNHFLITFNDIRVIIIILTCESYIGELDTILLNILQIFSFKNISTSASISFSSADIYTSSSDLNFLQIFSLKIISTSFVASISLSSGDILPSSSYLNFSVVHCTCVLCCLLQNWFVYSLCPAHHLKARPDQAVQVVLNGKTKTKISCRGYHC